MLLRRSDKIGRHYVHRRERQSRVSKVVSQSSGRPDPNQSVCSQILKQRQRRFLHPRRSMACARRRGDGTADRAGSMEGGDMRVSGGWMGTKWRLWSRMRVAFGVVWWCRWGCWEGCLASVELGVSTLRFRSNLGRMGGERGAAERGPGFQCRDWRRYLTALTRHGPPGLSCIHPSPLVHVQVLFSLFPWKRSSSVNDAVTWKHSLASEKSGTRTLVTLRISGSMHICHSF